MDSREEAPEVFVKGEAVTTLRFEMPCDPNRTKLLGWEGRFEPLLVGGRSVVIFPLRDLAPEDRFLLLVTLQDGTELPFTLLASRQFADLQVNVYSDLESSKALRASLEAQQKENQALREENHRREKEGTSIDHALAALFVNGQVSMTPFRERSKWAVKDEDFKADAIVLEGGGRAAVLFQVTNLDPKRPWKLGEARLSTFTTGESKPFALRMAPAELPPGGSGRIAIVMDQVSFKTQAGTDKLIVELFRDGGLRQVCMILERKLKR